MPVLLIVDDHPVVANSVAAIADSLTQELRTVVAHSLRSALAAIEREPEIFAVVTDLSLPDSKGAVTAEQIMSAIARTGRQIEVMVFTGIEHGLLRQHCLQLGASNFVTKNEDVKALRKVLIQMLGKGAVLRSHESSALAAQQPEPMDLLTKKQAAIWQDLAAGYSNPEIAERHGVGINTVKTHVKEIFDRIGVRNRTEAATLFFRQNRSTG